MVVRQRMHPGDYLFAAYNMFLAIVWTVGGAGGTYHAAPWIAIGHVAVSVLPWILAKAPEHPWGFLAAVREVFPILFLMAYWTELDALREILGTHGFEDSIIRIDVAVFGQQLHTTWPVAMDAYWFSEIMFFAYFAYYALILLPPLWLALKGKRTALRDVMLRMMATYFSCYLVYIFFPVYGPRYTWEPHAGPHTEGFFYQLVHAALDAGDSRGCAFPSSHVAGAVTIAWVGWRWFPRPIAALLTLEAAGVVLATVYTQNHYAIDSLAGIVWALVLQAFLVPVALRAWNRRPTTKPVHLLPIFGETTTSTRTARGEP